MKSSATSSASLTAISSGVWVLMAKGSRSRGMRLSVEIGDVPLRVNAGVRAAAAGEVHRCAGDLLQRLLQRLADGDGVFLHLPAVVGRSIIHQFQCDITHIGSFSLLLP